MTHTCPKCGLTLKYTGEIEGEIQHLPQGSHKYTPKQAPTYKRPVFK